MAEKGVSLKSLGLAFLAGGVVGATLALLFTPAKGEEVREKVKSKAEEAKELLKEKTEALKTKAEETREKIVTTAEELKEKGVDLLEEKKRVLEEAIQAGKEAMHREKDKLAAKFKHEEDS